MGDPRFAHLVLDIQTTLGDRGADRLSAVLPAGASAEALRPPQRIRPRRTCRWRGWRRSWPPATSGPRST
jgi:hypothetical protein